MRWRRRPIGPGVAVFALAADLLRLAKTVSVDGNEDDFTHTVG